MKKNVWTAADLLQLSGGYWNACALHAGVKLDLFSSLADRSLSAAALCVAIRRHPAFTVPPGRGA